MAALEGRSKIDWRKTPGQISLEARELLKVLAERAVRRFGARCRIVNIGVRQGASMHCLRAGAPRALLVGVDIDYKSRLLIGDPEALLLVGDSTVLHQCVLSPIHLLFVDGGHDEETVRGDIQGWIPKIPKGGFVAFHDYYMRASGYGVRAAVDEWKNRTPAWKFLRRARLLAVYERIS